jgi:acyl-CoA synthetase (AMP-forming)/AMP-acid ligase II
MVMLYSNYFIDTLRNFDAGKVLLVEGNQSVRAGELLDSSRQLASFLHKKGVEKGDRVVIAVKPGIQFLQIIYANMMLRTLVAIIDPEMGRDNYHAKLKQFNPDHAFADSRLVLLSEHPVAKYILLKWKKTLPSFPILKNATLFTTGMQLPIVQRHTHLKKSYEPTDAKADFMAGEDEDDFLITYTSGTLSQPKGVVHSFGSLANSIRHLAAMLQKNGDRAIATHLPHFALLGISAGIKVYLWDNAHSAKWKVDFIRQNNITTLFGPPSDYLPMVQYLNKVREKFPDSLKSIYLGSAPVYSAFLTRLLACCGQVNVTCLYGMTENLMVTYVDAREKVNASIDGDLVGTPFPNVTISIEDDGEIRTSSDQLFTSYFESAKHNGSHLTGDVGKMDERGRLILLGRKKDMIIRRNFNIYTGLYEPTINKIDGIVEAVMLGVYHPEKADEEVFLVIESEQPMDSEVILSKLKEGKYSIDKEALPDKIIFMRLPRSGRQQKVNRKELSELLKRWAR